MYRSNTFKEILSFLNSFKRISKYTSILSFIIILTFSFPGYAQIGYQVALINNATGEPRALETVTVNLSITNSEGKAIYSGSQSATTNDFGILSLSVGDVNTFKDVDWTKLPFFISAEADGVLIGKTQILSVPVAEYAKTTGSLSEEKLCSKTYSSTFNREGGRIDVSYSFYKDGSGYYKYTYTWSNGEVGESDSYNFRWYINGDVVTLTSGGKGDFLLYIPQEDKFIFTLFGERKVLS